MQSPHEGFEQPMVDVFRIDHESNGAIEAGDQQKAVDEGDVIGNQQRPAGYRDLFLSDDAEAVDRIGEQHEHEAKKCFRHEPHCPGRTERRGKGGSEEDADGGEPGVRQETAAQRAQ